MDSGKTKTKFVQAFMDMLPGGASGIKVRSTPGNHLVTLSKAMCIPEDQRDAQDLDMQSKYCICEYKLGSQEPFLSGAPGWSYARRECQRKFKEAESVQPNRK